MYSNMFKYIPSTTNIPDLATTRVSQNRRDIQPNVLFVQYDLDHGETQGMLESLQKQDSNQTYKVISDDLTVMWLKLAF